MCPTENDHQPSEVCEFIFTIRSVCEEIYTNNRHGTRREDITTTTTNNTTTQQGFSREDIFTRIFELITSTEMHSLYRGKASQETARLLVYLTLHRASVTIRNPDVLGPKGIFTDRRDLHNIMRKLEDLDLVEKFLEKPWKGGKHYALWNAVWASNSDIQLAIEEHNHSLEKEPFDRVPPPRIPDERLLIDASLTQQTEDEIRQQRLDRIQYYESKKFLSKADQQVLDRLRKQVARGDTE